MEEMLGLAVVLVALVEDRVARQDEEPGVAVPGEEVVDARDGGVAVLVGYRRLERRALERQDRLAARDLVRGGELVPVAVEPDEAALRELRAVEGIADRVALPLAEGLFVG